jgi:hypothetical protein
MPRRIGGQSASLVIFVGVWLGISIVGGILERYAYYDKR